MCNLHIIGHFSISEKDNKSQLSFKRTDMIIHNRISMAL